MTPQSNPVLISSLKSFSRASSLIVIVVGALVLVGWAFDIAALKSVFPGLGTMKANTAFGFALAGVSLWLLRTEQPDQRTRQLAQACAATVALLGLLTLSEYLFGWDLGIDQLLLQETLEAIGTFSPGRMAPNTALNFILVGLGLLLLDVESHRGHRPAQFLTLIAALVALLALTGYAYGVRALYGLATYTQMALHTAVAFVVVSIAILSARPDRGLMVAITGDSFGAVIGRRLLVATISIPLILGWLRLEGERAGLYDTEFGVSLFVVASIVLFAVVVWWNARWLAEMDTLRRRKEEELRKSEQEATAAEAKFRGLLETAPDAIVSVDREGRMVFVNGQTEKMFGYNQDELLGKPVEMLVPDRFRDQHVGNRSDYTSQPHARPMGIGLDIRGLRKDGSDIPVDIALSPVEIDAGLLVTAIIRDITDRKRAEKELQARYEELFTVHEIGQTVLTSPDLRSIVEGILDKALSIGSFDIGVIRLLDSSGKILKPIASRGYRNPGELKPHSVEPQEPTAGRIQTAAFGSREAYIVEDVPATPGLRTLKREGAHSAILIPVRAENQILGTILLGNRTPRKFQPHEIRLLETLGSQLGVAVQKARLFEETKRNLERIQALREIDQAITSTLNLDAILSLLLEKIDPLLSYPFASTIMLLSRETHELEPAACRHLDETEWRRHVSDPAHGRGNQWIVLETKAPLKVLNVQTDPQTRHPGFMRRHSLVSFLGVPLIAKGDDLGVLSIYAKEEYDFGDEEVELVSTLAGQAAIAIHNAQLYEEMSKLAGDLSKSNRVKDEFLSVMSHELRTPLNVVMGYTGMIKDKVLGDINTQQEDALDKVINRANDQLTMINNVLYATVIETEKVKAEMVEVNLGDFLSNLRTAYHGPIHKNLTLNWDYPSDLPVIKTDSAKLKQTLQNLINNALKFTEKGTVTISAAVVSLSPVHPLTESGKRGIGEAEKWVEFRVTDTGVGIPKEALAIIFEKFRQLDSSETRLYGGVGMGLYIVKKLAELLGGTVNVESESGKGSTFTVTIPLERRASMSE